MYNIVNLLNGLKYDGSDARLLGSDSISELFL